MSESPINVLILGAHPDDAEVLAGGLATMHAKRGNRVKLISVTNGGAGHHLLDSETLVSVRRQEARRSAKMLGAQCDVWDFADGSLQATLTLRDRIIREVREFRPDLVLTHRTCDYHPDHRAVGQAVQDASYMVTVPLVVPDFPIPPKEPVVAYMVDLFTKPIPMDPEIVCDIGDYVDSIVDLMFCHRSQFLEFLPFNQGILDQVPGDPAEQRAWLRDWFTRIIEPRAQRFRAQLIEKYGAQAGQAMRWIEAYEISEYAAQPDADALKKLFPVG